MTDTCPQPLACTDGPPPKGLVRPQQLASQDVSALSRVTEHTCAHLPPQRPVPHVCLHPGMPPTQSPAGPCALVLGRPRAASSAHPSALGSCPQFPKTSRSVSTEGLAHPPRGGAQLAHAGPGLLMGQPGIRLLLQGLERVLEKHPSSRRPPSQYRDGVWDLLWTRVHWQGNKSPMPLFPHLVMSRGTF